MSVPGAVNAPTDVSYSEFRIRTSMIFSARVFHVKAMSLDLLFCHAFYNKWYQSSVFETPAVAPERRRLTGQHLSGILAGLIIGDFYDDLSCSSGYCGKLRTRWSLMWSCRLYLLSQNFLLSTFAYEQLPLKILGYIQDAIILCCC